LPVLLLFRNDIANHRCYIPDDSVGETRCVSFAHESSALVTVLWLSDTLASLGR